MENNKSPERLIIYLIAAIWVFLLFYCTVVALKQSWLYFSMLLGLLVSVHVTLDILLVYSALSSAPLKRRILISGIIATTFAASLHFFIAFGTSELDLPLVLGFLAWICIIVACFYVLGSLLRWQFGPPGVRPKKLTIKTLMIVTTAVAIAFAVKKTLNSDLAGQDHFPFFYARLIFPKILPGIIIAWIAANRRQCMTLPVAMLLSNAFVVGMSALNHREMSTLGEIFLQLCLPDLIGSVILIWFYVAISRRGWQLRVASNRKAGNRSETDFLQSRDPVGVFSEDANA